MKFNLNKMFVVFVTVSSIVLALSIIAIVLTSIFVVAKGNIGLGVVMIVVFCLLFLVSALVLSVSLTWKKSMKTLYNFDNTLPNFYEQKQLEEKAKKDKNDKIDIE
ncbi:MAG: hypothetical protein IJA69_01075 [Clostridia bacterium]|nr:hypothetical protein [Clostridia bacterium]